MLYGCLCCVYVLCIDRRQRRRFGVGCAAGICMHNKNRRTQSRQHFRPLAPKTQLVNTKHFTFQWQIRTQSHGRTHNSINQIRQHTHRHCVRNIRPRHSDANHDHVRAVFFGGAFKSPSSAPPKTCHNSGHGCVCVYVLLCACNSW